MSVRAFLSSFVGLLVVPGKAIINCHSKNQSIRSDNGSAMASCEPWDMPGMEGIASSSPSPWYYYFFPLFINESFKQVSKSSPGTNVMVLMSSGCLVPCNWRWVMPGMSGCIIMTWKSFLSVAQSRYNWILLMNIMSLNLTSSFSFAFSPSQRWYWHR